MNRSVIVAHYIISVVFLLAILSLGAYRLLARAEQNLRASQRSLEALRVSALSAYLAEGGFDTEYFRARMSGSFRATERLRLLAVYSESEGVHYLLSRSRRLVGAGPEADDPRAWTPEYDLQPLVHVRLSVPFSPGIRSGLFMDGVFLRLDREDLYPILRELLLVLILYLGITTVLLLVAALGRPAPASRPFRRRASRRGELHHLAPPQDTEAPPEDTEAPPQDTEAPGGSLGPAPSRDRPSGRGEAVHPGLYSPVTGLGWRDFLPERLDHELERAASFDQDLALLLVAVRALAPAAGSVDRASYIYGQLGKYTLESFPLKDLAFEYDSHTVAVILPDRGLDRGLEEAKSFQLKLAEAPWLGAEGVRVWAGLSSRSGRLISGTRLLIEAGRALKKAQSDAGSQIVAFRADPQKFREALASGKGE